MQIVFEFVIYMQTAQLSLPVGASMYVPKLNQDMKSGLQNTQLNLDWIYFGHLSGNVKQIDIKHLNLRY